MQEPGTAPEPLFLVLPYAAALLLPVEAIANTAALVPPLIETILRVEGMMCGHCTATVAEALEGVEGVKGAGMVHVDLESKLATVLGTADTAALIAAVEATGKQVKLVRSGSASTAAAGGGHEPAATVSSNSSDSSSNSSSSGGGGGGGGGDGGGGGGGSHRRAGWVGGSVRDERSAGMRMPLPLRAGQAAPVGSSRGLGAPSWAPASSSTNSFPLATGTTPTTTPTMTTTTSTTTPTLLRLSSLIAGEADSSCMICIGGMTCAACVAAVERALLKTPGVASVSVSLMGKRGQVFYLL